MVCLTDISWTKPDGLNDGIERNFTNAQERDTDEDGIPDGSEDANHDGKIEVTETSPVVMDSDGDGLADGWCDLGLDGVFGTHDAGESNGMCDTQAGGPNESVGEDFNQNGIHDSNEPNPLLWDSDGDTLSDGIEVKYLLVNYTFNHDADGDGIPDVLERDADADGLPDNIENNDGDIVLDPNESDPYNFDTDNDGLPDGVEPSPFKDIDGDLKVNAQDQDSNADSTFDYNQTYILFRTTANDTNGDSKLEYITGTNITTFKVNNPDVTNMNTTNYLNKYKFSATAASLPADATLINVTIASGNPVPLRTPDGLLVYIAVRGTCYIYLKSSDSLYFNYSEDGTAVVSTDRHVLRGCSHSNEIADRRIVVDTRQATNDDTDFDGLKNTFDPNSSSRDSDNDGIIDGKDINVTNADTDGDGLPDGLEMGNTQTVPGLGTDIAGTCTTATFTWSINGWSVSVHNFTADTNPSTVTDPKNADTDGDGVPDGTEDCDMMNLSLGTHILKSSDLNGKYDGMLLNETNPLDKDTDDDGLTDGIEDANHNGMWDGSLTTHTGETCSWIFDTDADGLGDGMEVGKALWNITTYTNTSIFVPDADTNTTTNPLAIDTDGDGLPDGWIDGWNMTAQGVLGKSEIPDMEFQTWEGEDRNLNGKADAGETDPNKLDSDGDHLADGWDILSSSSLNLFTKDTSGVKRYWGELNYTTHNLGTRSGAAVYQSGPTDPTNIDSDGDGLVDGDISLNGCQCELVTSHNNVGQTMFTDPSLMDTDSDGLSDGMEVAGWEVHIIKGSSKMEIRNWTVSSNPTIIDSDFDGVNDYQEFENQSDPNCNDTDGDYILDGNEEQGQLTQTDAEPPRIIKFSSDSMIGVEIIEHHDGLGGMVGTKEIKLTVKVYDPSGIAYVIFKLEGQTDQNRSGHNSINATVSATFKYDDLRGFTDGWDVKVIVYDRNHNGNSTTMHIDGFCEGVLKAICKFFEAVAEAVGKLVSALFDWIWNAIQSLFNNVMKPIINGITNYVSKIFICLMDGLFSYLSVGRDNNSFDSGMLNDLIFSPFINAIMIIFTIIDVVLTLANPLSVIVPTLIMDVISYIGPLIVSFFSSEKHDPSNNDGIINQIKSLGSLDSVCLSTIFNDLIKPYMPADQNGGRDQDAVNFLSFIIAFVNIVLVGITGMLIKSGRMEWTPKSVISLIFSIVGMIFALVPYINSVLSAYHAPNIDMKNNDIVVIKWISLLFSFIGLALGCLAVVTQKDLMSTFSVIVGGLSVGISLTRMIFS